MTRALGIAALCLVVGCTSGGAAADPPDDPGEEAPTTSSSPPAAPTSGGDSGTTSGGEDTTTSGSGSGLTCWSADPESGGEPFTFQEVSDQVGLVDPLTGLYGHAAIWTDVDGDNTQDLFVGTFADRDDERYQHRGATGPNPDRLLMQSEGFSLLPGFPEMFSRTSGGATADLDLDGDLDLVLSRNFRDRVAGEATTEVLRNDGESFTRVSDTGLPEEIGGRSVAVFDHNLDGRPDLFITEDRWSGGSSVLLENRGDLVFEDVTSETGIPEDVHGLGVAAADFNNDGLHDLFVGGSNRLFIGGSDGFEEADPSVFQWEVYGNEDDVAGVSVADLNRDGWLDLAVGHHYNSTVDFGETVPVRIYLNRGTDSEGHPQFDDVTEDTGLPGLPTKAPHVELNDFDNDGWPDLLTSASAGVGTEPAIFRHEGLSGDVPQFSSPTGLGSAQYWVAAPTADFDRDGRLDVFLVEWEPALPSLMMRNNTEAGNWLQVSIGPEHGFGLGWRVDVFDGDRLIGSREITVTQGYSSGVSPIAHFGLGEVESADVILTPPGGGEPVSLGPTEANQHLRYPAGCSS